MAARCWFAMVLVMVLLAGCAGRNLIITTPSWHTLGSGLYALGEDRVIYGIGAADGLHNQALLRASADNQARKAMSLVLENYIDALTRSAMLQADPHWAALSADERRQATGMLARNCLKQAVISDHWNDVQQERLLALCRLDLATVKQVLADYLSLDENTRSAVWMAAERVHARLAKQY